MNADLRSLHKLTATHPKGQLATLQTPPESPRKRGERKLVYRLGLEGWFTLFFYRHITPLGLWLPGKMSNPRV